MGKNSRDFPKCSVCGDRFGSEKLLKQHFRIEHSEETYEGPAVEQRSLKQYWKKVRPHLNTSFFLGFLLGILLTSAVFGASAAWNQFNQPEPVKATVVTCDNCSYGRFVNVTDQKFSRTDYREVDYNSMDGQELAEKYKLRYVPGFIFEKSVSKRDNFSDVKSQMVEFADAYVLKDGEGEAARLFSEGFEPDR